MPGMDGVETLRRAAAPAGITARVLVVTSFTDPAVVVPAVRAGAAGVVYKDVEPRDLASAIRSVHAGHVLLQPDVAAALMAPDAAADRLAALTAAGARGARRDRRRAGRTGRSPRRCRSPRRP